MKLKNWSDESPPQAKLFYIALNIYKDILKNLKLNEIEIQERRKPAAGETFFTAFVTVAHK